MCLDQSPQQTHCTKEIWIIVKHLFCCQFTGKGFGPAQNLGMSGTHIQANLHHFSRVCGLQKIRLFLFLWYLNIPEHRAGQCMPVLLLPGATEVMVLHSLNSVGYCASQPVLSCNLEIIFNIEIYKWEEKKSLPFFPEIMITDCSGLIMKNPVSAVHSIAESGVSQKTCSTSIQPRLKSWYGLSGKSFFLWRGYDLSRRMRVTPKWSKISLAACSKLSAALINVRMKPKCFLIPNS